MLVRGGTTGEKAGCPVDNILKNVCDALNEVAYNDDVQVIEVICRKYYSQDEEYIEVRLEEIDRFNVY